LHSHRTGEFLYTVISDAPMVGLHVQSRPQTLTIVRGMLSGVAEQLGMDPELLDDLKTSVSEACNNVVLHAYEGEPGPMDVRVFADGEEIRVSVEDQGVGLPEAPAVIEDGSGGLGVSVMQALARELRLISRQGGGTEVVMSFDGRRDERPLYMAPAAATVDRPVAHPGDADDEVTVTVSPVELLSPVLGRVARTLAATAHFSLDRFSDVYLITDALAAHAARASVGDRITATLSASDRSLALAAGRFRPGTGQMLERRVPSPLSVLVDEVTVSAFDDGDVVELVVRDRR
jgi:serine/threonine-protein kinase RsbW